MIWWLLVAVFIVLAIGLTWWDSRQPDDISRRMADATHRRLKEKGFIE